MAQTEGYVIRVVGWNASVPCPIVGQFVEWFDPHADAWGGVTTFGFTPDLEKAKSFDDADAATAFYYSPLLDENNQPRRRCDAPGAGPFTEGHERPLTAFDVEIIPFEDDGKETA